MNIEAIVKKLSLAIFDWDTQWGMNGDGPDLENVIRAALTDLSESHAIELRACEATVENRAERIRQLEADLAEAQERVRVLREALAHLPLDPEGVPTVMLGNGDTIIFDTITVGEIGGGICFVKDTPHEIGAYHDDQQGKTLEEVRAFLGIQATRPESLRVLADKANDAADKFEAALAATKEKK